MLRSLALAAALVCSTASVGCAAEPVAAEERGSTASEVVSGADQAFFGKLQDKVDSCELLTKSETAKLESMVPPRFAFTAEVYGYLRCTVKGGELISAGITLENRAGFSSADGAFTETSMSARTSLNFEVKVVEASGTIAYETTVRSSERVDFSTTNTTSVGVDVSRNFKVVKASIGASFDGESLTGAAGASVPLPISISDCGGEQSVGVKVTLDVAPVPWDDTANRAYGLLIDDRTNQFASLKDEGLEPELWRDACCRGTGRC